MVYSPIAHPIASLTFDFLPILSLIANENARVLRHVLDILSAAPAMSVGDEIISLQTKTVWR